MNQNGSKSKWVRGVFATLLALLVFGVAMPNMVKVIRDDSSTPPTSHVELPRSPVLVLMGMVGVPLALIFIGMFRSRNLENVGWSLLIILTVLAFMR